MNQHISTLISQKTIPLSRWAHYKKMMCKFQYLPAEAVRSLILNSGQSAPEVYHCLPDKGHSFLMPAPDTFVCDPHASYTCQARQYIS